MKVFASALLLSQLMTVSHAFTLGTPSNVSKPSAVLAKTKDGNNSNSNVFAFLGTFAAAATILATAPSAANAANIGKGKVVFEQSCASCHKGGGNPIAKEETLSRLALEKYLGNEGEVASEKVITKFVKNSPGVHDLKLKDAEYSNVAAYVYNQAMLEKW